MALRLCFSVLAVCLCLALLSLNAVLVSSSNAYGTVFPAYVCSFANSIASYIGAPNSLYLACYGSGMIKVTGSVSAGYSTNANSQCHGAVSIAVNQNTGVAYGACALSGIQSWDPTTGVVNALATTTQCSYPSSVAVNYYTNIVYAACGFGGGVVSMVSTPGSSPTTLLTAAQCPTATAVAVDSQAAVVYAACTGVGVLLIRPGQSPGTLAGADVCASPQSLAVHQSLDVLYAVCAPSGGKAASLLTIMGNIVQSYSLGSCSDPRSVTADSYGDQIYVACGTSGGVVVVDPVSTTLTPVVPPSACHTATGMTASFGTPNFAYVSCSSPWYDTGAAEATFQYNYPNAVIGIDVKTTILATTAQCPSASELVVDNYANIAYVNCGSGYGILGASARYYTSAFVVNSTRCNGAHALAFNTEQYTLYTGCNDPSGISAITNPNNFGTVGPRPFTLTPFVPVGAPCNFPQAMTVDSFHNVLYAACDGIYEMSVNVYSPATVTNFGNNALCSQPYSIAVNPNTVPPTVYTACGWSNVVLNGSKPLLNNVAICSDPVAVAVHPTNGILYVLCSGNSVVLSILPNGTVTTITNTNQCQYPSAIAVQANSGVVYVACYYSGIVSITTTWNAPYTASPVYSVANVLAFSYCPYASGVAVSSNWGTIYALCGGPATSTPQATLISIYPY